jgi:hypothetical protein
MAPSMSPNHSSSITIFHRRRAFTAKPKAMQMMSVSTKSSQVPQTPFCELNPGSDLRAAIGSKINSATRAASAFAGCAGTRCRVLLTPIPPGITRGPLPIIGDTSLLILWSHVTLETLNRRFGAANALNYVNHFEDLQHTVALKLNPF